MKLGLKMFLPAAAAAMISSAVIAEETYSIISAPFGTGSYVLGAALEQVVNGAGSDIKVSHSESPGFVFNHNQLDKDAALRKTMIVGSGRGVNAAAGNGDTPFKGKTATVKLLANYNLGTYFLATLDSGIKSVEDLQGKSIGLGRRPQINWTVQPEALIRVGYGIEPGAVEYLGIKEAASALLDGRVDVAVVGGYVDPINNVMQLAPQTQEFVASGRDITFLSWSPAAVEKVAASGMPMSQIDLPAGSVPGTTGPFPGFTDTVSWTVHADFPEEAAYKLTKIIIANVAKFADYHALGKLMSAASLPYGWPVDEIHPGALRAYREAGILK